MAELRKLISDHIQEKKLEKKQLLAEIKRLQDLQKKIKTIDADITISEKYLTEIQTKAPRNNRKSSGTRKRTDRTKFRKDVVDAIVKADIGGISRSGLIEQLNIKNDQRAIAFLSVYLVELQKKQMIGRTDPLPGKRFGNYVMKTDD